MPDRGVGSFAATERRRSEELIAREGVRQGLGHEMCHTICRSVGLTLRAWKTRIHKHTCGSCAVEFTQDVTAHKRGHVHEAVKNIGDVRPVARIAVVGFGDGQCTFE